MKETKVTVMGQARGLQLVKRGVAEVRAGRREATSGRMLPEAQPVMLRLVQASAAVRDAKEAGVPEVEVGTQASPAPDLQFYRRYTEAMLRRYSKLSMESGRVSSLLGKELFRGRVTSCRVTGFDDVVIFCHDMERCLGTLNAEEQKLLKRIGVQEYTQGEAAGMLGVSLRTVVTRYGRALDRLTAVLLERRLLEPMREAELSSGAASKGEVKSFN